jgi:transposase
MLAIAARIELSQWPATRRSLSSVSKSSSLRSETLARGATGLGKKNYLFAGRRRRRDRAILASLINTAKLQDIDSRHYLTDVLERIVSGHTKINQLHMLLPRNWKAAERDSSQAELAA